MAVQVQTIDVQQGYVIYAGAAAVLQPITGILLVLRDNQVIAEYPVGRFSTWATIPEPSAAASPSPAMPTESESHALSAYPAGANL